MSWLRNSHFLCAALLLAIPGTAMATIMVVRSGGPAAKSYPLGKRLPEDARIVLGAADRLTLLDNRGTRELRGPGTFMLAAASAPTKFDPSRLFSAYNGRTARIGAMRPAEVPPRPPSVWHVDVSTSANVCVPPSNKITLWRADAAAEATLTVTGAGGTRQLAWGAGSAVLDWPTDLPVTNGAEYRLSRSGAAAPATIRFRTLPEPPTDLESTAAMLIANECMGQLDVLVDSARVAG